MADDIRVDHAIRGKNGFRRSSDAAGDGVDRSIAKLAAAQYGVVARRQLLERGIGRRAIDERLAKGRLHPIHRGVYAVGHRALVPNAHLLAAVLASGPRAVLSHRSAGRLWNLVAWRGEVEVTRPRGFTPRQGIRTHKLSLRDDEWHVVDGIPVTSPFRTAFDLAAIVSERELERLWNEVTVRGLTDKLSPWELLRRYPGRRGTVAWRRLLESEAPAGITRSELEEAFVAFLDAHALRRPRLNGAISLRSGFVEADCVWDDVRLLVELDGRMFHHTARSFEADRRRDRLLLAEGWRTMRVTWRQLRTEPHLVAADLQKALQPTRP